MKETTKKIVSRRLTKIVALVLMCVICTSGVITVTALSRDVTVVDGDKMYALTTLNANPDAVLDRLGIELAPHDAVEFDEAAATITITRAVDVAVRADGKVKTVTMTEGTVADALKAANVTLKEGDQVIPFAATALVPDMEIKVARGIEVSVEADGKTISVKVPATATVGSAVTAAGQTILQIGAYVIFFSALIASLGALGFPDTLAGELALYTGGPLSFFRALFTGALELSSGVGAMAGLPLTPGSLALGEFLLSWGGLCVHGQAGAAAEGLKMRKRLGGKLLQGVFSATLAYAAASIIM